MIKSVSIGNQPKTHGSAGKHTSHCATAAPINVRANLKILTETLQRVDGVQNVTWIAGAAGLLVGLHLTDPVNAHAELVTRT